MKKLYLRPSVTSVTVVILSNGHLLAESQKYPIEGEGSDYEWGDDDEEEN